MKGSLDLAPFFDDFLSLPLASMVVTEVASGRFSSKALKRCDWHALLFAP